MIRIILAINFTYCSIDYYFTQQFFSLVLPSLFDCACLRVTLCIVHVMATIDYIQRFATSPYQAPSSCAKEAVDLGHLALNYSSLLYLGCLEYRLVIDCDH